MKFFLKRTSFLAIILLIIANFLFGNVVLAKGIKITDKDIGRIKTGLSLMKALVNYTIGDNTLKTALNITIGGGETGADITYGLVVLTAINEMDFIDMVASQRYKQEATVYFDQVINEKTNLISFWKGVGYDLPRVAMGYVTGPIAGLTLNSFSITNKIISIFTALNVIKTEKRYDGLWYYFSLRRENKMPHQEAWEDAKLLIGWAVTETELAGFYREKSRKSEKDQLESQFAALWDKWGHYTDSKGITEMAKEQFREEMGQIVAEAIKKQALAEKSKELSLLRKAVEASKNFIKNATETVKNTALNIISAIKSATSQFNPFGAEVSQPLSFLDEGENIEEEEVASVISQRPEEIGGPKPLDDAQDQLDDIAEKIDVLEAEMVKLGGDDEEKQDEIIKEEKVKEEENEEEKENEELEEVLEGLEVGQGAGQKLCEKIGGIQPIRNKVIFNEITWMGGVNSANGEWIELKNISGGEINLTGWQILDKDNQIKIIFSSGGMSSAIFYLLERTSDDSVPEARADKIYSGTLNNENEALYIFNKDCQLEDEVLVSPGWPAGDNFSKRTMERRQDFGWQTSANAGGTPKTGNSGGYIANAGGAAPPPPPPPPPPSPFPIYPKILISEIQISPSEKRFIELYNPSNENLNLTDWYIQRKTETGIFWVSLVSSTQFEGKAVNPHGHFLITSSTEADILLNLTLTENNSLILKNPDREIVDLIGWGNAQDFEIATTTSPEQGKSLGRKWSTTTENYLDTDNNQNDFEIQTPTPKSQNQSPTPEPEPDPEPEEPLLTVVINEIAWMGTNATDSSDEWIELYNNSSSTIDLNNWRLTWSHGTTSNTTAFSIETASTTIISGHGFYLMERTDNNTISDISADLIYTGVLGNDGEKLELKDSNGQLIDMVDCSSGWFSGSSSPNYISMERINPNSTGTSAENWANNNLIVRNGTDAQENLINGTPKAQNSAYQSLPPNPISDLALDSQNSSNNKAVLIWSSSTDPDTLSENLSYKIYYSREGTITEDNLTASTTFSATTSATAIAILDLYYNSAYYFGLKVFDGQNYSSLSNIVSRSVPSALIDSSWTMFRGNLQRNSQSDYSGPSSAPTIIWVYDEENDPAHPDNNPLYTSPIIRPEGTVFSSAIFPASKQGVLTLNPDGSKKSFQEITIDKPLVLQPDGSALADEGKTKNEQGDVYLAEGDVLKKADGQGNIVWQRSFEFENPYSCSTSTPAATLPAIGENGIIYVAVRNNSCNQNGDGVDYLYLLSSENETLEIVSLSGYRSSLLSVSSNGNAYIFYLIYGNWPPRLYLAAISSAGEFLWRKQIFTNYNVWSPSPVLIDNQENLYFVVGKDVFVWAKDGNEIWKLYLGESVPANWYVGDIGIVLNNDGTLYLSGRGAILGLR